MAYGGGNFTTTNKILPGSYVNCISAGKATSELSERGIAAMPMELNWCPENEFFSVTAEEFYKNSMKIFGYPSIEMTNLQDLFLGANKVILYRINSGGQAASCTFATAKYTGTRGNGLKIIVQQVSGKFIVKTYLDNKIVDEQKDIMSMSQLKDNDYIKWKQTATLNTTAGMPLTGGTNGNQTMDYEKFLAGLESRVFHTLGYAGDKSEVKQLFSEFTQYMRNDVGAGFQCVLCNYDADYEGIISVNSSSNQVYWVVGASAGCGVNESLTGKTYTGNTDGILADFTNAQLEENLTAGKFCFHRVGETIRVLQDINSKHSFTPEQNEDFRENQTIRLLDQTSGDVALIFNEKYLGKVPNDEAGRVSFWNDIVTYCQKLENIRAIENFEPDEVDVIAGDAKNSVVVSLKIEPICAMTKLYMTIIVQ